MLSRMSSETLEAAGGLEQRCFTDFAACWSRLDMSQNKVAFALELRDVQQNEAGQLLLSCYGSCLERKRRGCMQIVPSVCFGVAIKIW